MYVGACMHVHKHGKNYFLSFSLDKMSRVFMFSNWHWTRHRKGKKKKKSLADDLVDLCQRRVWAGWTPCASHLMTIFIHNFLISLIFAPAIPRKIHICSCVWTYHCNKESVWKILSRITIPHWYLFMLDCANVMEHWIYLLWQVI